MKLNLYNKKIMKKLLFFVIGLLTINANAADLYVNNSGAISTYPTLTLAIAAANSGDRIFVFTNNPLSESITIDKSITIAPYTSGDYFILNGSINIKKDPIEVKIIGVECFSIDASIAGTATETNRCNVYIVDSKLSSAAGNITANSETVSLNVLYCDLPNGTVEFQHGKIIGSTIDGFYVEPGGTYQGDTTFIIANKILTDRTYKRYNPYSPITSLSNSYDYLNIVSNYIDNDSHHYYIANNYFILNPTFYFNGPNGSLSQNQPFPNLRIYNNVTTSGGNLIANNCFINNNNSSHNSNASSSYWRYGPYFGTNLQLWYSKNHNKTNIVNNFFKKGYGGGSSSVNALSRYNIGSGFSTNTSALLIRNNAFAYHNTETLNYYTGSQLTMDPNNYFLGFSGVDANGAYLLGNNLGELGITYFDIDMTRNDIGTYGGPHSMDNYWDTTSLGVARIFGLDMPFELWPAQNPTIKADAVHRK